MEPRECEADSWLGLLVTLKSMQDTIQLTSDRTRNILCLGYFPKTLEPCDHSSQCYFGHIPLIVASEYGHGDNIHIQYIIRYRTRCMVVRTSPVGHALTQLSP